MNLITKTGYIVDVRGPILKIMTQSLKRLSDLVKPYSQR